MLRLLTVLSLLPKIAFNQFVTLGNYEYYFEFDNNVDYETALRECKKHSSELVIIADGKEDLLIHQHIRSTAPKIRKCNLA